jgi:hypothetical protein
MYFSFVLLVRTVDCDAAQLTMTFEWKDCLCGIPQVQLERSAFSFTVLRKDGVLREVARAKLGLTPVDKVR